MGLKKGGRPVQPVNENYDLAHELAVLKDYFLFVLYFPRRIALAFLIVSNILWVVFIWQLILSNKKLFSIRRLEL